MKKLLRNIWRGEVVMKEVFVTTPPISTISTNFPATDCPIQNCQKLPNHYRFTMKMANEMFAEMLDNFHHSTKLILKNRSCTLA
jgi:hypothetical protein